ncbi:MAG: hypothetical protein L6R35_007529, partial [Caloplaca aegaea]
LAAVANKEAYAANQANAIEPASVRSGPSSHALTAKDELDEFLRLEATLQAKIAALRVAAAGAAST